MQPEIDLFGLPIKTFGLCFALAFLAAGALVARRLKERGESPDWAYELLFAAMLGGLVGARLWYLADHTAALRDDPLGSIFSGSGLTWYGGALGGAIGAGLWARRRGMTGLVLVDLCAAPLALGYALGRIGCQVSGDGDYGKAADVPWAMPYPDGVVPTTTDVHPTPLYETVTMGLVAYVIWRLRDRLAPGYAFALYLVLAGFERFVVEFWRRNDEVAAGLTVAQLVSLAMVAAGAAWLARGGVFARQDPQVAGASRR
jgi:phosphatidylglycerol:prolipoprotein diacylglycerol transferase